MLEGIDEARALDAADPMAKVRDLFAIPRKNGTDTVYLCGHSLGLQCRPARDAALEALDAWAARGVEGHFVGEHPWYSADERPAEMLSALVGAQPDEVAVANALTVNLHLLMASFFRPGKRRRKILIEDAAFPSDRYAVTSQLAWHGLDPAADLVKVAAGVTGRVSTEDVCAAIDAHGDELALALLGGVHYLTGEALQLDRIVASAHAAGALVGFDLAHAAGNRVLRLHDDGVDFAAWCNYKYLNGGPGSVGALFVHERHLDDVSLTRLAGWWGNDPSTRFAMHENVDFVPARGARGWKVSNPPIVSVAAVRGALEVFCAVGMDALARRSRSLTATLESLTAGIEGVTQVTTTDPARRGAMLTLRLIDRGERVVAELAEKGITVDFRSPDVLRVAPAPLYNTYEDVWRFAAGLKTTMVGVR